MIDISEGRYMIFWIERKVKVHPTDGRVYRIWIETFSDWIYIILEIIKLSGRSYLLLLYEMDSIFRESKSLFSIRISKIEGSESYDSWDEIKLKLKYIL
jgi:hypothetical protein